MSVINQLETAFNAFANFMWSTPLVVLLVGGGIGLMLYSRFRPYRHLGHALALLRGRYNDEHDPGHVSHAQALSTALSGTLGLGNVAGVTIAINRKSPAFSERSGLQLPRDVRELRSHMSKISHQK